MPDVSRPLVAIAKSTGLAPQEWSQAIAPHCHHYKPTTDKVVDQYPPGTGYLLSLMPASAEAQTLYLICFLIVVAAAGLAMLLAPTIASVTGSFLVGAVFIAVLLLRHGNNFSLWPALVAVILAGALNTIVFTSTRRIAAAFVRGLILGVGAVIRVADLWLASGPAIMLLVDFVGRRDRTSFGRGLAYSVGLAVGLAPLAAANAINAGAVWASTYSARDTKSLDFSPGVLAHGLSA